MRVVENHADFQDFASALHKYHSYHSMHCDTLVVGVEGNVHYKIVKIVKSY